MWEMEGRSTSEIASELGIKESAVRHTVSRARASLRRVLSELVIDEERGLTALDMLSTSYKKAAEIAQKSSKVALSLLLVVTAFLGFNSLTGNEGNVQVNDLAISTPTTLTEESVTPAAPVVVEAPKVSTKKSSGITVEGITAAGLEAAGLKGVTSFTASTATAGAGVSTVDLTTATGSQTALSTLDKAINTITDARAAMGAYQNRLNASISNLETSSMNLQASRSRILDTDYAKETTNLAKSQIIQQAATAMLAQANQSAQSVLSLLK
jgi:flagellin-like hook-associated protein FlgL